MCRYIIIISQNRYSQLSKCENCNLYSLTYNNILFEFTPVEFESFKRFLEKLELESCTKRYKLSYKKRNIPIGTIQQNLFLVFSSKEIKDIRKLLSATIPTENYEILPFKKIDYKLQLN